MWLNCRLFLNSSLFDLFTYLPQNRIIETFSFLFTYIYFIAQIVTINISVGELFLERNFIHTKKEYNSTGR